MYSKPSPVAALAAVAAGGTVLGLSAGVTYGIIGGIVALVVVGFIIIRFAGRRGRR
jgi:uncharacterized membrane protein YdjX (TVP38/TMEM64 family)